MSESFVCFRLNFGLRLKGGSVSSLKLRTEVLNFDSDFEIELRGGIGYGVGVGVGFKCGVGSDSGSGLVVD